MHAPKSAGMKEAPFEGEYGVRFWSLHSVLTGHKGSIAGVLVSVSGAIVSWDEEGSFRLWSEDGELLDQWGDVHRDGISDCVACGDNTVAVWGSEGQLAIYHAVTRARRMLNVGNPIADVIASKGNNFLILSRDGALSWYIPANGTLAKVDGVGVRGAIASRRRGMLVWSDNRQFWLDDAATELVEIEGARLSVVAGIGLENGRFLYWGDEGIIHAWKPGENVASVMFEHGGTITGVTEITGGRVLSWDAQGAIRMWGGDGRLLQEWSGALDSRVLDVQWLKDGRLAVRTASGSIVMLESDGRPCRRHLLSHPGGATGNLLLPDQRVLSWGGDGSTLVWDAQLGSEPGPSHFTEGVIRGGYILPGGNVVLWGGRNSLQLWKSSTVKVWETPHLPIGRYTGTVRNGPVAMSWDRSASTKLWHLSTPESSCSRLIGHRLWVTGVVASRFGFVSWSFWDNSLNCWGGDGRRIGGPMRGHTAGVRGAVVLRDGRIMSWSEDGTLRLWHDDGRPDGAKPLIGHSGPVLGAMETQDGHLLSWGSDGSIRIWHADGRRDVTIEHAHEAAVYGVLELSAGVFFSHGSDGTVGSWHLDGTVNVPTWQAHLGPVLGAVRLGGDRILTWSLNGGQVWGREGNRQAGFDIGLRSIRGGFELDSTHLLLWNDQGETSVAEFGGGTVSHRCDESFGELLRVERFAEGYFATVQQSAIAICDRHGVMKARFQNDGDDCLVSDSIYAVYENTISKVGHFPLQRDIK